MKRPIAMRCNQEQFDSIKDRIAENHKIGLIDNFETHSYLINNIFGDLIVLNINEKDVYIKECDIYEKFNADIFLEACGVEFEKVFILSDLQMFSNGEWHNCHGSQKYRLKPQPDYSKEIEALQQKAKENGMSVIIKFEKL